jgi:glycosyltransferase involved in cell wall biosynthesis
LRAGRSRGQAQEMTEKQLRILVICTSYPKHPDDGSGHFVRAEVEALRRAGHDVTVLAAGGPHQGHGLHSLGGAALFDYPGAWPRFVESPSRLLQLAPVTLRVRRFLKSRRKYDGLICHWLLPSAFPWGLAFESHHKEVVIHGSDLRLLLRLPRFASIRILRALQRQSFKLRFVSSELKSELARSHLPSDLQPYVENAIVRAATLDLDPCFTRGESRKRLGIDPAERWAVLVGRLIPEKRTEVALRAAQLVPELKVAVLGSGPLEDTLRRSYPDIRFLGHTTHSETLRWIAAADVLLAPSRLEGAPTAVREARTLGTPVVTAPSGDTLDWAREDKELWVV